MPLTQAQANTEYIINSVAQFLDRTAKAEYDARASSKSWSTPVKIALGSPDDPDIALDVPKVAIAMMESKGGEAAEIGSTLSYRYQNFVFYCYPALDNGQPSKASMFALIDAMRNALATENIRVMDFGNPSFSGTNKLFTGEVMQIVHSAGPMPRGSKISIAQEANRFDMYLQVKYPVIETFNN